MLPSYFDGQKFRIADNWFPVLPVRADVPIQYLEIGTYHGANVLSVALSYCKHPESRLTCIDPWEDYEDYPEYKEKQETNYSIFSRNLEKFEDKHKIIVKRGYSHEQIPLLEDASFDMIYIDGNHEPEYVLEDAVLAFRKLKTEGILIFDDYGWGGPDMTKRGIDGFIHAYHKRIRVLGMVNTQVFVQKIR